MSLLRASLVLISTACVHYSLSALNLPVSGGERRKYLGYENQVPWLFWLLQLWPQELKTSFWVGGLCEVAIILASRFPALAFIHHILSTLVANPDSVSGIRITRSFLAGFVLTTFGTFFRYRCFRELGKFFTYQLAIRKDHQLVTSGPYSIVRHPSYTTGLLAWTGMFMCLMGPGSWLKECGILDTCVGRVITTFAAANIVGLLVFFVVRIQEEDMTLRKEFGEQWDRWAKEVPYRLIPYVY